MAGLRLSKPGGPIYYRESKPVQDIFSEEASQKYRLNTELIYPDGRKFRYTKNGATTLAKALLVQSEAIPAEAVDEIQTGYTTAVGDETISCLLTTASGILDNELIDGWVIVNKATGLSELYQIKSNKWTTGDTVIELELYDVIRTATVVTSEMTFSKNKAMDVIVAPTNLTAPLLGVPLIAVTANYYFWSQTKGLCPVLVDTGVTLVLGELAGYTTSAGATVPGAIGNLAATDPIVGVVRTIAVAAEPAMIDLMLEY